MERIRLDSLYRVKVCPWLPATVLDREGNEVELLGVLASPGWREPDPRRIVFLTGKAVQAVPQAPQSNGEH